MSTATEYRTAQALELVRLHAEIAALPHGPDCLVILPHHSQENPEWRCCCPLAEALLLIDDRVQWLQAQP